MVSMSSGERMLALANPAAFVLADATPVKVGTDGGASVSAPVAGTGFERTDTDAIRAVAGSARRARPAARRPRAAPEADVDIERFSIVSFSLVEVLAFG